MDRRPGRPHSCYGFFSENTENILPGFKLQILTRPADNLITILTELLLFLSKQKGKKKRINKCRGKHTA
jgi:hypothetical protein